MYINEWSYCGWSHSQQPLFSCNIPFQLQQRSFMFRFQSQPLENTFKLSYSEVFRILFFGHFINSALYSLWFKNLHYSIKCILACPVDLQCDIAFDLIKRNCSILVHKHGVQIWKSIWSYLRNIQFCLVF